MGSRHPLPYAFAKTNTLLLEDDGERLLLWAAETTPHAALAEVTRLFDVGRFEREAGATLGQRIAAAYAGGESSAAAVIGEVESGVDLSRMMQELPAVEDLLEAADDAPIIRMLNALLTQAAKDGASDIHIEPYERSSAVRFRVDGTLREVVQPNRALHAALISRLKIMAELDIAEKRLPQDGRISLRIRPQIGEGGAVRMTIFQEQSSVKETTAAGTTNAGPSTTKRSIENTVVVDDGAILVLGGLIEDRFVTTRNKVPVLGDIPFLGALFRSESRERRRTNLIVFLRPIVLRDAESANRLSLDRYDRIRGEQTAAQPAPSLVMPINEAPVLPPLQPPAPAASAASAASAATPTQSP